MEHLPILYFLACNITNKLDVDDISFAHLTLTVHCLNTTL